MKVRRTPSRVAAFDIEKRRLRIIYSSHTYAAKNLGVRTASVCDACSGKSVSCGGWYLRSLENVEVGFDDFGTLTIEKFDELNGVERVIYPNDSIRKKRSKKAVI